MLARISFEANQKVTEEFKRRIEMFLLDEVTSTPLVREVEDGKVHTFYSYIHTYETPKEGSDKKLVEKTDQVELSSGREYICRLDEFIKQFPKIQVKVRGMIEYDTSIDTLVEVVRNIETRVTNIQDKLGTLEIKVD